MNKPSHHLTLMLSAFTATPALAADRPVAETSIVVRTADLDLGSQPASARSTAASPGRQRSVRRRLRTSTSPARTKSAAAATKPAPASPPSATGWSSWRARQGHRPGCAVTPITAAHWAASQAPFILRLARAALWSGIDRSVGRMPLRRGAVRGEDARPAGSGARLQLLGLLDDRLPPHHGAARASSSWSAGAMR